MHDQHNSSKQRSGINASQHQAVHYLDGPCLVLAGAGSGKTTVITQKIAYLLQTCSYPAHKIYAITFTNKAAREMSERVRKIVGPKLLRGLNVSTFHSLGLRFLRIEHAKAGLKANFSIFDSGDSLGILQELLATTDKARLRAVAQTISLWKNALLDPDQAAHVVKNQDEQQIISIYRSYQATLRAYQAVDFDDLIGLPTRLLSQQPELRQTWQDRVHYLLIDEYQDTNACQYEFIRQLVDARAMFTAVGDDDQAIYAWRGASADNLKNLAHDYPNLKVIKLEQNYRSVQSILAAANKLIKQNPKFFEKSLWSELGQGAAIAVSAMDSDLHEAESIAIRLAAARFEHQAKWSDFAILYRSNHQARLLEQALRNLRIPYTVSGGQSFFDKTEIRDLLAWLRVIANPADDPAFIRAATNPRRGIGQSSLQALGTAAAHCGQSLFATAVNADATIIAASRARAAVHSFTDLIEHFQRMAGVENSSTDLLYVDKSNTSQLLDELLQAINYEQFLYDNLDERQAQTRWGNALDLFAWLKDKATEDDLSLLELVQRMALINMLERQDDAEQSSVKLSTLHAAKGLEFPYVYLIGIEEGLLPHRGNSESIPSCEASASLVQEQQLQEERRLMYVGITRAKLALHLSWCRKRRRAREYVYCEPSRFIKEMGLEPEPQSTDNTSQAGATLNRLKNLLQKN